MPFPPTDRYLLQSYSMESPGLQKLASLVPASGGRFSSPLVASWFVTLKCNLACKHCWIGHAAPEPTPQVREKIALRLAEANLCRVSITGGEATLVPELGHYVQILKRTNTPVSIYTNAIAPAGPARGKSWPEFLDPETDYAQVSLDGGCREQYEGQRGRGTFGRFLEGVDFLRRNGVRMQARYIGTPFNGADVHSAARLALDLGFEGFSAELFYPEGRAASLGLQVAIRTAHRFNASVEKLLQDESIVKSALELGIGFPIEVPLPPYVAVPPSEPDDSFRVPIAGGRTLCFVTPSGEVAPVTHLDSPERHRYGSLLHDSLKTIWKNEKGIAGFSRERDLSRALCATCPDFPYCKGGRHERALGHWGTWDAHDPWCHFCRQGTTTPPFPGNREEEENDHGRLPR